MKSFHKWIVNGYRPFFRFADCFVYCYALVFGFAILARSIFVGLDFVDPVSVESGKSFAAKNWASVAFPYHIFCHFRICRIQNYLIS